MESRTPVRVSRLSLLLLGGLVCAVTLLLSPAVSSAETVTKCGTISANETWTPSAESGRLLGDGKM